MMILEENPNLVSERAPYGFILLLSLAMKGQ